MLNYTLFYKLYSHHSLHAILITPFHDPPLLDLAYPPTAIIPN